MTAAVLALLISWSPVISDCEHQPEPFVRYELTYVHKTCHAIDTEFPWCETFIAERRQTETEWRTSIGKPEPDPGSGYWFEVIAVDGGGHRSDECSE